MFSANAQSFKQEISCYIAGRTEAEQCHAGRLKVFSRGVIIIASSVMISKGL